MSFTKKDLKTGMFGVATQGCKFVIVNNLLVYEDGNYDVISNMTDDLKFGPGYCIEKLYDDCYSFKDLDNCLDGNLGVFAKLVYDRNEEHEMTISEIEAKLGIKNLKIIKEDN